MRFTEDGICLSFQLQRVGVLDGRVKVWQPEKKLRACILNHKLKQREQILSGTF